MRFHSQHQHQLCEESGVAQTQTKVIIAKIVFTLQRDSMFPLWFHKSNTFRYAGIRALTRPHQLEHASSPLPSAVLIFASFDLTSRKSYCFTFSRIFQMSHQRKRLKYFPLVRPWLDLPQRLQWDPAATPSPWQVLSFAPINTSSPFDQIIGVKWTFLLKRSNHIPPWISAPPGQTGTDPPSICGTNTGYHSEPKSIDQNSKHYQQSNLHFFIF